MAVTRASFILAKPEFSKIGNDQIDAALAAAELETSDTAFGTSRDWAVILKTADMLAQSPAGRDARMVPKGVDNAFSSTYGVQLKAMQEAAAVSASRFGTSEVSSEDE